MKINDPASHAAADAAFAGGCSCAEHGEVAAYLDGELDANAALAFERHAERCPACRRALDEQRRTLAALDAAFTPRRAARTEIELPANFSRSLAARARADVGGVRAAGERRRAFKLCLLLVAACAALSGSGATGVLRHAEGSLAPVAGLCAALGRVAGDLARGACALSRVAGDSVRSAPDAGVLALCLLFGAALALLWRLVGTYRCEPRP